MHSPLRSSFLLNTAVFPHFHGKDRSYFMGTTSAVVDLPPKSTYLYAVPLKQKLGITLLMMLLQVLQAFKWKTRNSFEN